MSRRIYATLLAVSLMSGCAMEPLPVVSPVVPESWHFSQVRQPALEDLDLWQDPLLKAWLAAALQSNPGLEQVAARLAQARAQARNSHAASSPAASLSLSGARNKAEASPVAESAGLSGAVSWEIDVFGRLAAKAKSDDLRADAQAALLEAAKVSLAVEVARGYWGLRAVLAAETLTQARIASLEETLRVVSAQIAAGAQTATARLPIENALADATAQQLEQTRSKDSLAIQLATLTGIPMDALVHPEPTLPALATPGLAQVPATVLQNRPDVQAAEATMRSYAAYAEFVHRGTRYPVLSLGGAITAGLSGMPSSWALSSAISAPLQVERGRAVIELSQAQAAETRAQYRAAVSQAVAEVEQALSQLAQADAQASLSDQAAARQHTLFQADLARFQTGLLPVLALEESRRAWLSRQQAALSSKLQHRLAVLSLYHAVGGGVLPED
jgi:outer membrane protein TolC